MKKKKELDRFIERVNELGRFYIHDASFSFYFEKWIMLPFAGIRFRMDEEQFNEFMSRTNANFLGHCTYGQGIGLDRL